MVICHIQQFLRSCTVVFHVSVNSGQGYSLLPPALTHPVPFQHYSFQSSCMSLTSRTEILLCFSWWWDLKWSTIFLCQLNYCPDSISNLTLWFDLLAKSDIYSTLWDSWYIHSICIIDVHYFSVIEKQRVRTCKPFLNGTSKPEKGTLKGTGCLCSGD